MISTILFSNIIDMSCTWEIIFKFMERASHDSISKVKGFLNTITMMDINIDIQDSLKSFEKFQNSENTVINIAKSWGLRLFGMMETARPIEGVFGFSLS